MERDHDGDVMNGLTLDRIRMEVAKRAARIGAPSQLLPTYGFSDENARPHVEVSGATYHYVVSERGEMLTAKQTHYLDELLYWIFEGVTFQMGLAWELAHRIEGQDPRRLVFAKQLELLAALDPLWNTRNRAEKRDKHLDAGLEMSGS